MERFKDFGDFAGRAPEVWANCMAVAHVPTDNSLSVTPVTEALRP
jgi:hypothetical protein